MDLFDILPVSATVPVLAASVATRIPFLPCAIGLAAFLTDQFYSPAEIIMDDNRQEVSRKFGVTKTVNSGGGKAVSRVMDFTSHL